MNITAHNFFVFYSCISSMHRPGSDATVGKRCMKKQKKFYAHAMIYPWRCIATRGEEQTTMVIIKIAVLTFFKDRP
jgi:hypothetical protein